MIYGFYFRFLKYTKSKTASIFLARLTRFLFLLRFQLKRLCIKKRTLQINAEQAENYLKTLCPDVGNRPVYSKRPTDQGIDLSIIVPVYNYVKLVENSIQSILKQETKYRYELILIDDGSTDGSKEIVKKYVNYPGVKIVLQENQGIAGARNTGINEASGKYLMFVDCDDTIQPDMVEEMLQEAYSGSFDVVMCAHDLVKINNGKEIDRFTNCYPDKNLLGLKNHDEIMNYPGLPWGKVYRRELFEQVRFFPGYWFEDTIVHFLLYTQCNNYFYLQKSEYNYRWYDGNYSHIQGNSSNIRSIEYLWLLQAILEQYECIGLPKDRKLYTVLLRHLSAYCYPKIKGLDEKAKEAVFVLACKLLREYSPSGIIKLPYMLKLTERAMMNGDYELWKLTSCNQ